MSWKRVKKMSRKSRCFQLFGAVRMVFSCVVAVVHELDAAWRGRFSGACKHELQGASHREGYSGEGSTSHPAR